MLDVRGNICLLYFEKSIMEVIILAGGLGTRLRSVVSEVPKCMAPIAGKPFLWYILKYLTKYNVSKVILSVGYLREVIFQWIDKVKDDFSFSFDCFELKASSSLTSFTKEVLNFDI